MPRPPEFDRDQAIEGAMDVFWRKGYAGTSLKDLDKATGLFRGSLYNAFGDKQGLFMACLDKYGEAEIGAAVTFLSGEGKAFDKVQQLFLSPLIALEQSGERRGCLLCNTAIEMAPHNKEIEEKVCAHLGTLREAFLLAILGDCNAGERDDADRTADMLTASYMGLLVLVKAGFPMKSLQNAAFAACRLVQDDDKLRLADD